LTYLTRRLDGLMIVLLVALRPADPAVANATLLALRTEAPMSLHVSLAHRSKNRTRPCPAAEHAAGIACCKQNAKNHNASFGALLVDFAGGTDGGATPQRASCDLGGVGLTRLDSRFQKRSR
jgi:hypothetical protein